MFAINVPLGIVAFCFAWRLITQTAIGHPPPLDKLGVLFTCGALGAVTYAGQVVSDGTPQWTLGIALVLASAALYVAATLHLLRSSAPLINLRTLRIPTFSAAMSGSSLFWLVVGAIPFLLPLLFQTVFGWSAIKSGSVVRRRGRCLHVRVRPAGTDRAGQHDRRAAPAPARRRGARPGGGALSYAFARAFCHSALCARLAAW
jgi:hypothetical protein